MAKRFTDTEKWKKQWYRELGSIKRDALNFLYDNCDNAGFWDVDMSTLAHFTGIETTLEMLMEWFPGRLVLIKSDKLFIPSFIEFQYGSLSEDCKPHHAVLRSLERHRIDAAPFKQLDQIKGYPKGISTLEDKDKDKDNVLGKSVKRCVFDFDAVYRAYPRKVGKSKGIAKCRVEIKSPEDFEALKLAIKNYAAEIITSKTEPKFIKHFSTFMGCWRDYLETTATKPHPFAEGA